MLGRRQRHEERLYWKGFRDALVRGVRDPDKPMSGPAIADQPRYPQGFVDGKQAAKRVHRDALVSEVSRLSLRPGDKLVVKSGKRMTQELVEELTELLKPRFPDNEILICDDIDLSVVRA